MTAKESHTHHSPAPADSHQRPTTGTARVLWLRSALSMAEAGVLGRTSPQTSLKLPSNLLAKRHSRYGISVPHLSGSGATSRCTACDAVLSRRPLCRFLALRHNPYLKPNSCQVDIRRLSLVGHRGEAQPEADTAREPLRARSRPLGRPACGLEAGPLLPFRSCGLEGGALPAVQTDPLLRPLS
jgi:hypothetical protein